jgi:predicted Rossmann fold flavoprotein
VRSIEKRDGNGFYINLEGGRIEADRILVATGGSPKEEAYSWLKATGHSIISPVPSLFTFNINDKTLHELAGVSVKDTWIKLNGSGFSSNGPLLITHWGMSGPVVLKLSAWAARYLNEKKYDFSFSVNWLPGLKEQDLKEKLESLRQISRPVEALSPFAALPLRLWKYLCLKARIPSGMKWPEISRKDFNRLVQELGSAQFASSGKTTYKEEFVTSGGVNLKEVDFRTMQSKKCEGLFFAGEVLDIDAVTGGFNFQSAWTTGWIAGKAIGA